MEQKTLTKLEPSVDLGILVGLLLTDGSVSKRKTTWTIELTGKSIPLHKIFKEKITKIFGIEKFTEFKDKRDTELVKTKFSSTSIASLLHQVVPTFRTRQLGDASFPKSRLPEFIFSLSSHEIQEILRVMFSADGGISMWISRHKKKQVWEIRKRIFLASRHPKIREQVVLLLKEIGIESKDRKSGEVVIWKKSQIEKFHSIVGFVSGVEVTKDSKHWTGFEKSQILDLAVKTFDFKKKDLQKFRTKEEIISFLKSFLAPAVVAS